MVSVEIVATNLNPATDKKPFSVGEADMPTGGDPTFADAAVAREYALTKCRKEDGVFAIWQHDVTRWLAFQGELWRPDRG